MRSTGRKPFAANIFADPIGWAGTMVGSRTRYLFSLIFLPFFILLILNNLAGTKLLENWSSALLIIAYNIMFVYSLRALYRRVESLEGHEED